MVKPSTQVAGVVGIDATPITMNEPPPARIDWRALSALPPFQMFIHERRPAPAGNHDSQQWAARAAQELSAQQGEQSLMDDYCRWHAYKGHWPEETPFGHAAEE